jgi:hypothetical protein
MLCALGLEEPCPTFRPAHPDGLRPPQQLSFVFRTQPRRQPAEPLHAATVGSLVPSPPRQAAGWGIS